MQDDAEKILRETVPNWIADGQGLRGTPALPVGVPQSVSPQGRFPFKVENTQSHASFPELAPTEVTQNEAGDSSTNEYSFELEFDKVNVDNSVSTIINYGEVNGEPPEGMTSDSIFTFDLYESGTEIYLEVGYDETTLAIDSITLEFALTVPDSELGILRIPIGYVDWETDEHTGKPKNISPHNRQCGDVNVAFIYGALNGKPAIYTLAQYSDPQSLESVFD